MNSKKLEIFLQERRVPQEDQEQEEDCLELLVVEVWTRMHLWQARDLDYLELEWHRKHLYLLLERKEMLVETKQQQDSHLHQLEVVWVRVEIISVDLMDKYERKKMMVKKKKEDYLKFE